MAAVAGLAMQASGGLITPAGEVAYSFMAAPGTAGAFFAPTNSFGQVALDGTGRVSFLASGLLGGDVTTNNTSGYWTGTSIANLTKVNRGGEQAPGFAPGINLINASGASGLNASSTRGTTGDKYFFGATVSGPGITASVNDTVIYFGNQSGQTKMVQRGDAAPGTAGAVFNVAFRGFSAQNTAANINGHLAFSSALSGGDTVTANNAGIYAGPAGSLVQVSRKGDVLDAGLTLSAYQFNVKINGNNQVMTDVTLGGSATSTNNKASYIYTPGSGNVRVARNGDVAPGTAAAVFSASQGVGSRSFSNAGLMFYSALTGGDTTTANSAGYWLTTANASQSLIVRRGDAAPGTDGVFNGLHSSMFALTNSGVSIFQSSISGGTVDSTNDTGMWMGTAGSLSLIAREGDYAPGTAGAVLASWMGSSFATNNAGQVVFNADLLGGDTVGGVNSTGMFGYTPGYGLTMITRTGDQFEVSPGVFKTIVQFNVQSGDNGGGSSQSLNDNGQIAISLSFSDGSNAIVLSVVPAPGAAGLASLGGLVLAARRRRN